MTREEQYNKRKDFVNVYETFLKSNQAAMSWVPWTKNWSWAPALQWQISKPFMYQGFNNWTKNTLSTRVQQGVTVGLEKSGDKYREESKYNPGTDVFLGGMKKKELTTRDDKFFETWNKVNELATLAAGSYYAISGVISSAGKGAMVAENGKGIMDNIQWTKSLKTTNKGLEAAGKGWEAAGKSSEWSVGDPVYMQRIKDGEMIYKRISPEKYERLSSKTLNTVSNSYKPSTGNINIPMEKSAENTPFKSFLEKVWNNYNNGENQSLQTQSSQDKISLDDIKEAYNILKNTINETKSILSEKEDKEKLDKEKTFKYMSQGLESIIGLNKNNRIAQ